MAWLDERLWCHPKIVDLSDAAFRAYVCGLSYSSGFGTSGGLSAGQQRTIGADTPTRDELVAAGLWHTAEHDAVTIHHWDEHNAKRDARRRADRERKRLSRQKTAGGQSTGTSAGQSAGQSQGTSTGPAHVEGSEGSDGSEGKEKPKAPTADFVGGQELVAHLVDESKRLGVNLPTRTKGQAAKVAKQLLDDGMGFATIAGALTRMLERGRPVSALTDIAREIERTPATNGRADVNPYRTLPRWDANLPPLPT